MKYVLGTVQLGLDYGINNDDGRPTKDEAFAILSAAYDGGILTLDTASGYGDSEKLIGEFMRKTGKRFAICSKFSGVGSFLSGLDASLKALSVDRIFLYYLHRYEDCLDSSIVDSLVKYKEKNIIERVGVSIYTPEELDFITYNLRNLLDVVQIPFSIFDCSRWISAIEGAYNKGLDIYCRSVFLQGAIFKSPNDGFVKRHNADEHFSFVHGLCEKYNTDIGTLAFSFCVGFEEISGVLFGAETLAQLKQNLVMLSNLVTIDENDMVMILDKMKSISPKFIDPRTWHKD